MRKFRLCFHSFSQSVVGVSFWVFGVTQTVDHVAMSAQEFGVELEQSISQFFASLQHDILAQILHIEETDA